jgi:serine/threonine-protein kinase
MRAPTPTNEPERLAALLSCGVLDTAPEASFDDITRLAGQLCDAPIALVSLVAADRQWFKARVGIDVAETSRDLAFCAHALGSPEVLVVRDTLEDARFADNPFVLHDPSIRFYAGAPLMIEPDVTVGTLCVLDRVPRDLTASQLAALAALARQVSAELKLRRTLASIRPLGVDTEQTPRPRALEGRLVDGRYRIERVLGVGAMGIVVAAHDETANERVAIKFLGSELREGAEAKERFVREAKAVLRVGGEHVASVLDVGNLANGAPFIVMEHLDGEDLEARLQREGPLPAGEAIAYVLQACAALGRAHAEGIVHRDLKPANLFLTRRADGSPLIKVLDFGVSKFSRASAMAEDFSLTQGAALIGSPYYMSPEQMRGADDLDARTDVWALGVILYELLARSLPFEGKSLIDLCSAVMTAPARPLDEARDGLPPGLAAVVHRCLAKQPGDRYPTVDALAAALRAVADPPAHPSPATPPAAPRAVVPSPRARRGARWIQWFAVVALLALLATVVLIMAGNPR